MLNQSLGLPFKKEELSLIISVVQLIFPDSVLPAGLFSSFIFSNKFFNVVSRIEIPTCDSILPVNSVSESSEFPLKNCGRSLSR